MALSAGLVRGERLRWLGWDPVSIARVREQSYPPDAVVVVEDAR